MTATKTIDAEWAVLDCERVLYVDRGREVILCDREQPGRVTLVVKLAKCSLAALRAMEASNGQGDNP